MKIITLQQRLRILILVFSVIVLTILGAVIYPNVQEILDLKTEIDATETFLEERFQKTRRMERLTVDIDTVVTATAKYVELSVSPGTELAVIQEFESLAETYVIDQQLSVSFSEKQDADVKLRYYEFTFLNHGLWSSHIAYLDALFSLPFVVSVDEISMQKRNSSTGEEDVLSESSLRFSARVYVK